MKTAPLLLASVSALETSSTAHSLLTAVGHRNATKMEALVQGLVEESISEPGWKFDQDIKDALEAIRSMFVKNIQAALTEAMKVDQEHMNCFTKECFSGCLDSFSARDAECNGMEKKCEGFWHGHVHCRHEVKGLYIHMAQSCGALHSFILGWEDEECTPEKCLCPDLTWCHQRGGPYDECSAHTGDCASGYGSWLKRMIQKYQSGYAEWSKLYGECKMSYHAFLTADMSCDATQKSFEQCMCEKNRCHDTVCNIEYENCYADCSAKYEGHVFEKQCLEKDRKIDWSATKKIECYVDILLHDYTKEELLSKCGSETCINEAREADYKHCHTICLEVDYEGVWPSIIRGPSLTDYTSQIDHHAPRPETSQYLLGDTVVYECDMNGAEIFTNHRGGVTREEEKRCTEHLDIDFQIPPCKQPCTPPPPVCDEAFHKKWYFQYDDASRITEISDCCPLQGETCFADVTLKSSSDGHSFGWISVSEHTHAWAFNRCPCTDCVTGYPTYPAPTKPCGFSAASLGGGAYAR
jgi:hypothetical protein